MGKKRQCSLGVAVFLCLLLMAAGSSRADTEKQAPPSSVSGPVPPVSLGQSIREALLLEKANLGQIEREAQNLGDLDRTLETELNAFNLLLSNYGNLLALATTEVKDLEKALVDLRVSSDGIAQRLRGLTQKRNALNDVLLKTEERLQITETQVAEIKSTEQWGPVDKPLLQAMEDVRRLLTRQLEALRKALATYDTRTEQLAKRRESMTSMVDRFMREIEERKREALFQRKEVPFSALGFKSIGNELEYLSLQVARPLTKRFWQDELSRIWERFWFTLTTLVICLGIVLFLLFRLRRLCTGLADRPFWQASAWRQLFARLFLRSLVLLGSTLFLHIFSIIQQLSSGPLFRLIIRILVVLLFSRWVLDATAFWVHEGTFKTSAPLIASLRSLTRTARAFAVVYLITAWLLESVSLILFSLRLVFEVGFVIWSISFWKRVRQHLAVSAASLPAVIPVASRLAMVIGHAIALGGLFLELAGYGQLALHWYGAWATTMVVVLWAGLFYALMGGYELRPGDPSGQEGEGSKETARPGKWLLIRLAWLLWFALFLASLLFAWGAKRSFVFALFAVMTRPIEIGSIRFSLVGFFYASLVLVFTHWATRIWRHILRSRVLADSGIEPGMQESITTITVYAVWAFGILLSLTALGLSTTTITVAFGALSVGLGFGLQNIFNNFVSGIILLFERPVQVGDVVQINDVWGTVAKINVRSTVVQTFDNASLIIPNSDMISNQVVNWSFRDLRIRRIITVGVAYGSDTQLVRETLLEVARKHPKILKKPKADVLFRDFGDSALIFWLRLWTTIDHFIEVETDVRFEIDRLFREKNIEISFPQRDIHIRSVVEKTPDILVKPQEAVHTTAPADDGPS